MIYILLIWLNCLYNKAKWYIIIVQCLIIFVGGLFLSMIYGMKNYEKYIIYTSKIYNYKVISIKENIAEIKIGSNEIMAPVFLGKTTMLIKGKIHIPLGFFTLPFELNGICMIYINVDDYNKYVRNSIDNYK